LTIINTMELSFYRGWRYYNYDKV